MDRQKEVEKIINRLNLILKKTSEEVEMKEIEFRRMLRACLEANTEDQLKINAIMEILTKIVSNIQAGSKLEKDAQLRIEILSKVSEDRTLDSFFSSTEEALEKMEESVTENNRKQAIRESINQRFEN